MGSSVIGKIISVITLKSKIKELDATAATDDYTAGSMRRIHEERLKSELRCLWKDALTPQQLKDEEIHDDADDNDGDDDAGGGDEPLFTDDDLGDNYEDSYDHLYDLYDI